MFFRKKLNKKSNLLCTGLTETNDCKIVSEIRQWQKELDEVDQKIQRLEKIEKIDAPELYKFILSKEFLILAYDYKFIHNYGGYFTIDDALHINQAISHIDNLDKFFDEIREIYNRYSLIAQEKNKSIELRNKISDAKKQLGIE